jgi:hypothetical protein
MPKCIQGQAYLPVLRNRPIRLYLGNQPAYMHPGSTCQSVYRDHHTRMYLGNPLHAYMHPGTSLPACSQGTSLPSCIQGTSLSPGNSLPACIQGAACPPVSREQGCPAVSEEQACLPVSRDQLPYRGQPYRTYIPFLDHHAFLY